MEMRVTETLDPITLEVVRNGLISTVKEMTDNLVRTAYSPIAAEIKDFSVGLHDLRGDSIMQAPHAAPAFIADLDVAIRKGIELYGLDGFEPGDIVLCNDAATNGQHLNNMAAYTPIIADGELLGFAAVRSHWIDVGGMISGSMPVNARDIFAEGWQFPTMKVYRAGKPDAEMHRFISVNSRFPELVLGDMRAQISACRLGERRFKELVAKYGKDTVLACIRRIWDEAEMISRKAVEAIPDGTYEAACRLDNDGITLDKPIPLRVKVIVSGSDMTVDFSGTSPQVEGPYNSRAADAVARIAFKYLTTPTLPANAGAFRNLKLVCPEGTVLSASGKAPMAWWNMPVNSSIDLILKALYPALPHGVTAGHSDNIGAGQLAGTDPRTGKPFQTFIPYAGAWGATHGQDGQSGIVSLIQGDVRLMPIELRENMFPMRIVEMSLRPDSGGAGRFRGGLGVKVVQEALADCQYQAQYERTLDAPWPLAGGKPGAITETWKTRGDQPAMREPLPLKCNDYRFTPGDREVLLTGGGGGYGSPLERDLEQVRADVLAGYVSVDAARAEYGVVIDPATLEIDRKATQKTREENHG